MAKQRPQARTASELRAFLERGHERLVSLDADHVAWLGSSTELAQALGIKRQAMTSRLRTLRSAHVADTSDARRIVFDVGRLTELASGVRHLRLAESTQQFRSVVGETYEEQRSADGGVAYRHRDTGQRASVRDLTRAAGYVSPSSTQYHLKVLADTSPEITNANTETAAVPPLAAPSQHTQPLTDALTELTALLSSAESDQYLKATVLGTIAAVSRSGLGLLTGQPSPAARDASSSRGSRHDDATTLIDPDYEVSNSTSEALELPDATRTNVRRVEAREENASVTRRPHLAPEFRELGEAGPHSHEEVGSIFAPLVAAVSRSHPELTPNWTALAGAAAPWPVEYLRAAVGQLATQLDSSSRSGERPIDNPYAVFSAAAKRGDLEYFALRPGDGGLEPAQVPGPESNGGAPLPSVSQESLRSCLIADLERSDRPAALNALVERCKVDDHPEVLADLARRIVLAVEGQEGLDYFDQQLARIDPQPPVHPRRLSKDERRAIIGAGRGTEPR